jgi:SPP1 family predicted phage head-tail adaptor
MIDAGSLDRRITILGSTKTRSPTGVEKSAFAPIATVWAGREALNLRETTRMAGTDEAAEAKFVIRHSPGITTANQIECDGQHYAIVGVDEMPRREGLKLLVRAI